MKLLKVPHIMWGGQIYTRFDIYRPGCSTPQWKETHVVGRERGGGGGGEGAAPLPWPRGAQRRPTPLSLPEGKRLLHQCLRLARRLPLGAMAACVVAFHPKPLCGSPNIWLHVCPTLRLENWTICRTVRHLRVTANATYGRVAGMATGSQKLPTNAHYYIQLHQWCLNKRTFGLSLAVSEQSSRSI